MRHDPVLKLNQKPHTPFGIASFIIALTALVLAMVAVGLSANEKDLGIMVGVIELVSAMLTLAGIGAGVIGENDQEMEKLYAHIGLGLNTGLIIFHLFVVWFGFII